MNRKSGQLVIMGGVFLLILTLVWYMYQAQNLVPSSPDLGGLKTQVIGTSGYQPPQTGYTVQNPPAAKAAISTKTVAGIEELTYIYGFGEAVVLNSLPTVAVTSNTDVVRWSADPANSVQVQLANPDDIQTYFYAPNQEVDLIFQLGLSDGTQYVHVANFVIHVFSPLTAKADINADGVFSFEDLLLLLQRWPQYGADAVQMLAVILSRYQTP